MLVDTHSHIYSEDFLLDRDEVIENAIEAGITKIVMPNIDSASVKKLFDVADAYPQTCFPLMGLHPTSVGSDYAEELHAVEYWLGKRKVFGIGEIGIDLYWDRSFLKEQEDAFRRQLQLARTMDLPVVIHVRDSFKEVYSILEKEHNGTLRGVFHCFNGTLEEAQKVVQAGFFLGIGGVVTFRNSQLDQVLKQLDVRHLLLETDSPYLAPVPKRGRRNESAYLTHIAQRIADIYAMPLNEVASITTRNAQELFRI